MKKGKKDIPSHRFKVSPTEGEVLYHMFDITVKSLKDRLDRTARRRTMKIAKRLRECNNYITLTKPEILLVVNFLASYIPVMKQLVGNARTEEEQRKTLMLSNIYQRLYQYFIGAGEDGKSDIIQTNGE